MRVIWWLFLFFVISSYVSSVDGTKSMFCERMNCTFNVIKDEEIYDVELEYDSETASTFKKNKHEKDHEDNVCMLKKRSYGIDLITQLISPRQLPKSLNGSCRRDVVTYLKALGNLTEWAIRMLDASSKIQSGILTGNLVDLGMYDECISIRAQDNEENIQGRYCLYMLRVPRPEGEPIMLTSSICLPASCNSNDSSMIINNFPILRENGMSASVLTCSKVESSEEESWPIEKIVSLAVIGTYVFFLVLCTICDFIEADHTSDLLRALGKFSLYRNARRFLSTKSSPQTLPVLQGIKFLSALWIALAHEYLIGSFQPLINAADVPAWSETWTSTVVLMGSFSVDTFLLINGFLLAYHFFKQMDKGRKFNLFSFYLHRYVRLTPVIVVLLVLSIFVFSHVHQGPISQLLNENFVAPCRDKWLSMFLYTHNLVKVDRMCMPHMWYLAVEMQLFWISPIILFALLRKPKTGFAITGITFVTSIVSSAIVFATNRYIATMYRKDVDVMPQFKVFYTVTFYRIAPWLIGIWMGYDVATKNRQLSEKHVWLGWFLTAITFSFCLFGHRKLQAKDYEYSVMWETFYGIISRPVWAVGIAWIIYASIKGHGGLLSKFLSLPIFLPLSRLTYCFYLIHIMVQGERIVSARTAEYFTNANIFNKYLNTLVLTTVTAFVMSLLFESPLIVLEKICMGRHKVDQSQSQKDHQGVKSMTEHTK